MQRMKTLILKQSAALWILILLAALAGCGQKGDLYRAEPPVAGSEANLDGGEPDDDEATDQEGGARS